jgi:hypothetical protein
MIDPDPYGSYRPYSPRPAIRVHTPRWPRLAWLSGANLTPVAVLVALPMAFLIGLAIWLLRTYTALLGLALLICVLVGLGYATWRFLAKSVALGFWVARERQRPALDAIKEKPGEHVVAVWGEGLTYVGRVPREPPTQEAPVLDAPEPAQLGLVRFSDYVGQIPAGQLLVGVRPDGSPRLDTIKGSTLVLGKSRSGKTMTIAGRAAQAVRNGALLVVCDPHGHKPDSLVRKILPLQEFLWPGSTLAIDHQAILANVQLARAEMERRVSGGLPGPDMVLIIEEYNRLFDDDELKDDLAAIGKALAREGRGFGIFGYFGAQDMAGGSYAALRKLFLEYVLHRAEYADAFALVRDPELAKQMMQQGKGQTVFIDAEGEREHLLQPLITPRDIADLATEANAWTLPPLPRKPDRVHVPEEPPEAPEPAPAPLHTLTHRAARVSPEQRDFILQKASEGLSATAIATLLWNDAHKNVIVKQVLAEERTA